MQKCTFFKRFFPLMIGICGFGLLSIWALPGTIALRHILLGVGLVLSISYLRQFNSLLLSRGAWPFWVSLCLFLWLLFHLWLFSNQVAEQTKELLSIWARSIAALPIGLAIGIFLATANQSKAIQTPSFEGALSLLLFLGYLSTPLIFIGFYLHECYLAHQWIPMTSRNWWELPFLQKPPFVVATALLLPLCCAFFLQVLHGALNLWWALLSLAGIFICITCNYLTNTKNGMAMAALTLILFGLYILWQFFYLWAHQKLNKTLPILIMLTILIGGVGWGMKLHLEKNPAWTTLLSDTAVGIDIDNYSHWKNRNLYPPPLNNLGKIVEISTYERTAWFTAGIKLLKDRPQGYGLIHHSFGWMASERWPDFYPPVGSLRGMTHSGWMDLALGIGIPGLLLIWIPLGVVWYRSIRKTGLWDVYTTLGIPVFFFCYLTTEVTGAHHYVELLIFMTALFTGLEIERSNVLALNKNLNTWGSKVSV